MSKAKRILIILFALLIFGGAFSYFVYPGPIFWIDQWWGKCIDFNIYDDTKDFFPYTVAVDWSPDGKILASGGYQPDVLIWDPFTGELLHRLKGHDRWLENVKFSPDGSMLASSDWLDVIYIWDTITWEPIHKLKLEGAIENIGLSFHPTRNILGTGAFLNGRLHAVDLETGKVIKEFKANNAMDVAYAPDGKTFVAAGADWDTPNVVVLETENYTPVRNLVGHDVIVTSISFSNDGKKALTCGDDGTVKLWNYESGEMVRSWDYGQYWVISCSIIPGADKFLTADLDKKVRIWDMDKEKPLQELEIHKDWVISARASRDGRCFASGGKGGLINIYDIKQGKLINTIDVSNHMQPPPVD